MASIHLIHFMSYSNSDGNAYDYPKKIPKSITQNWSHLKQIDFERKNKKNGNGKNKWRSQLITVMIKRDCLTAGLSHCW